MYEPVIFWNLHGQVQVCASYNISFRLRTLFWVPTLKVLSAIFTMLWWIPNWEKNNKQADNTLLGANV